MALPAIGAAIGSIAKGIIGGAAKKQGAKQIGAAAAKKILPAAKQTGGTIQKTKAAGVTPQTKFIPVSPGPSSSAITTKGGAIVKTGSSVLDDAFRILYVSVTDLGSTLKAQEKFKRKRAEDKRKRRIALARSLGKKGFAIIGGVLGFAKSMVDVSFLDRIKKFFINVIVGSLVNWFVSKFEEISKWWTETWTTLKEIFDGIKKYIFDPIFGFVTWVGGPAYNLIAEITGLPKFDDGMKELKNSLKELEGIVPEMDAFNRLMQQEAAKNNVSLTGTNRPPAERPSGGGSGSGGSTGGGSMGAIDADTPEARALIKTIRTAEGTAHAKGYDTWFGGRTDMKMTDMTLQEVYDEQTRRLNSGEATYNGLTSAAVGVGQFMNPLEQARAMYAARGEKFDPTKIKFDEKLQNDLLLDLAARKRGIDPNKELTKADFDILQMEWAGLGTYHGQTKRTTADSLRMYQGFLGSDSSDTPPAERPPVGDTPLPPLPPSTAPAQQFGASRSGGARQHAGQDFDISGPNATFPSQIGGVVTNIGYDPAPYGYGHYADIYNEELNVTERIAEGAQLLVKKGDRVAPGQVVTKGETYTGVIHYEIRKGRATTFGYADTVDPKEFLKNKKRVSADSVSSSTSYERPRVQYVPVAVTPEMLERDAQKPVVMTSSGGVNSTAANRNATLYGS